MKLAALLALVEAALAVVAVVVCLFLCPHVRLLPVRAHAV
jgi:hypothetical protein